MKEESNGKVETKPWDAADYIETPDDVVAALQAAFDEAAEFDDPGVVAHILGVIARSRRDIAHPAIHPDEILAYEQVMRCFEEGRLTEPPHM